MPFLSRTLAPFYIVRRLVFTILFSVMNSVGGQSWLPMRGPCMDTRPTRLPNLVDFFCSVIEKVLHSVASSQPSEENLIRLDYIFSARQTTLNRRVVAGLLTRRGRCGPSVLDQPHGAAGTPDLQNLVKGSLVVGVQQSIVKPLWYVAKGTYICSRPIVRVLQRKHGGLQTNNTLSAQS